MTSTNKCTNILIHSATFYNFNLFLFLNLFFFDDELVLFITPMTIHLKSC